MNSHEFAAKVAEDKAASFTLQRMIATAAERDVLDALIDAEALVTFCKLRAKEAGLPINTPMAETAGRECVRLQGINAELVEALRECLDKSEDIIATERLGARSWAAGSAKIIRKKACAAIAKATT